MSGKRRDDERLTALLRGVRAKGTEARYCVVGAGNGGLAMAGHLGILGYPVTLYNRTADRLRRRALARRDQGGRRGQRVRPRAPRDVRHGRGHATAPTS